MVKLPDLTVRWAPLKVPLHRRRQTFAVLCFVCLLPLSMACHLGTLLFLIVRNGVLGRSRSKQTTVQLFAFPSRLLRVIVPTR